MYFFFRKILSINTCNILKYFDLLNLQFPWEISSNVSHLAPPLFTVSQPSISIVKVDGYSGRNRSSMSMSLGS